MIFLISSSQWSIISHDIMTSVDCKVIDVSKRSMITSISQVKEVGIENLMLDQALRGIYDAFNYVLRFGLLFDNSRAIVIIDDETFDNYVDTIIDQFNKPYLQRFELVHILTPDMDVVNEMKSKKLMRWQVQFIIDDMEAYLSRKKFDIVK